MIYVCSLLLCKWCSDSKLASFFHQVHFFEYHSSRRMRETVSIHVGQCGNQIGNQFWNLLLHEHEKTPDDDESLSAFFRFEPQRNGSLAMKARALLIDMECGPLTETKRGPLGALFDETQFVMDVSGASNNFAQGHYMYGPQYRDRFMEGVRRNAEHCDSLQTFLVTHSLGGGTGSGVGTFVLGMLSEEFPKICRFSTCVYPSENSSDVTISPYNVMLATNELIEHADCVFPLDNAALFSFAQRERSGRKGDQQHHEREEQQLSAMGVRKKDKDRGFDAINGVAARMLCHLTSSSRFPGEMNVDLNEIYTNLVPYPRLHFLITALSLRPPPQQQHVASSGPAGAIGRQGARVALQRAFGDVLAERGQIAAALPVYRPGAAAATALGELSGAEGAGLGLGSGSGTGCMTLSCAFLARGRSDVVPHSDFIDCVTAAQKALRFPQWNQNACKIGICNTPSPGERMSVLAVYNSSSFGSVLDRELARFQMLFRRKAMLHHYTEYVTEGEVAHAEQNTCSVLEEYRHLERFERISGQHRAQLRGQPPNPNPNPKPKPKPNSTHTPSSFMDPAAALRPVQLFPAF